MDNLFDITLDPDTVVHTTPPTDDNWMDDRHWEFLVLTDPHLSMTVVRRMRLAIITRRDADDGLAEIAAVRVHTAHVGVDGAVYVNGRVPDSTGDVISYRLQHPAVAFM